MTCASCGARVSHTQLIGMGLHFVCGKCGAPISLTHGLLSSAISLLTLSLALFLAVAGVFIDDKWWIVAIWVPASLFLSLLARGFLVDSRSEQPSKPMRWMLNLLATGLMTHVFLVAFILVFFDFIVYGAFLVMFWLSLYILNIEKGLLYAWK